VGGSKASFTSLIVVGLQTMLEQQNSKQFEAFKCATRRSQPPKSSLLRFECVKVTVFAFFTPISFFSVAVVAVVSDYCWCCCCNLSAKKFAYQNSKRHLFQRESVCQPRRDVDVEGVGGSVGRSLGLSVGWLIQILAELANWH